MVISGGGGLLPASLTQGIPTTNDLVNQHPRASQQQSVASTEAQSDPPRESTKSREVMPFEDLFFAWGRGSNPVGVSQEGMRTGPALSPSGQLVLAPLRSVSLRLHLFFCFTLSFLLLLVFIAFAISISGLPLHAHWSYSSPLADCSRVFRAIRLLSSLPNRRLLAAIATVEQLSMCSL